jgi:hypothetical protein
MFENKTLYRAVHMLAIVVTSVCLLALGFYLGEARQEKRFAELLVGQTGQNIGVLVSIEREKKEIAKDLLVKSIETDLIILAQLQTSSLDEASKEILGLSLNEFAAIRARQPRDNREEFKKLNTIVDAFINKHAAASGVKSGTPPKG